MNKVSPAKVIKLRAKHQDALWKVEKLWAKMGETDYASRVELTQTAIELLEIDREIKKLETYTL